MTLSITWIVTRVLLFYLEVSIVIGKSISPSESIDLSHYGLRLFGSPSKDVGEEVANWRNNHNNVNPEELGTYLEGDILFTGYKSRNGLTAESARWPKGHIPFEIVGDYGIIFNKLIR